jgi:hypothetical protein
MRVTFHFTSTLCIRNEKKISRIIQTAPKSEGEQDTFSIISHFVEFEIFVIIFLAIRLVA